MDLYKKSHNIDDQLKSKIHGNEKEKRNFTNKSAYNIIQNYYNGEHIFFQKNLKTKRNP